MLGGPTLSEHCPDQVIVRTFPAVLGFGAGLAVVQGAFDYTGGKFSGYDKDSNVDEYERKEALRKNRRRPIQETLEQLGEGRGEPSIRSPRESTTLMIIGVYGPAYRERRADRIKENYGIGTYLRSPCLLLDQSLSMDAYLRSVYSVNMLQSSTFALK